jgi:hypothetical protein
LQEEEEREREERERERERERESFYRIIIGIVVFINVSSLTWILPILLAA